MVEIIHLAPGEDPPAAGEKYILYEWTPDGEMESEQLPLIGSRHRVPDAIFDRVMEGAERMAEHLGHTKVYVRGRPA